MKRSMAASSFKNTAVAICSALGAQAPTWPKIAFILSTTACGPKAHPTLTPVAANDLEIPSM